MTAMRRVTTEYVAQEDRVRLVAELDNGSKLVCWLTQRLVVRLVPALLAGLKQTVEDHSLSENQQKAAEVYAWLEARVSKKPVSAVRLEVGLPEELVVKLDVKVRADGRRILIFHFLKSGSVRLPLSPSALRLWLGALQLACEKGDWRSVSWPEWLVQQ